MKLGLRTDSGISSASRSRSGADASLVKVTNFTERYALRYTLDVYNLTNTSSFDVPGNEVAQNASYNAFPAAGAPVLPGTCNTAGQGTVAGSFYSCPAGLGIVTHAIGSPRQVADVAGIYVLSPLSVASCQ